MPSVAPLAWLRAKFANSVPSLLLLLSACGGGGSGSSSGPLSLSGSVLDGPVVGADLVELNPTRDPTGLTAMVAAKLAKELLALLLTEAAMIGKWTCALGTPRGVSGTTVGLGMMPRGEVGLIFAGIGARLTLAGEPVGTWFAPRRRRRSTRLLWLEHASESRGALHVDDGAVRALQRRRTSLLPAGITSVRGTFSAGDPVDLVDSTGHAVARGLVNYDSDDLPKMLDAAIHHIRDR